MNTIRITVFSHMPHNAQIVTGFRMLRKQGCSIHITDSSGDRDNPFAGAPLIRAEYLGKTIFYDLWDGYQCPDRIQQALSQGDLYFKRSFSPEKNKLLFPDHCRKMFPLGFNYHVVAPGTPFAEPLWKASAKQLLGRVPDRYFTPDRFEGTAMPSQAPAKILFLTRLWDPLEPGLSEREKQEREQINHMRIVILRALAERYGEQFVGGLNDTPLSRRMAPELIVSHRLTERKQYLRILHSCDICIASTGLHESIGWKTGEYVAAAKAIVTQPLCYHVPGDFREGTHYLSYCTAGECLNAVQALLDDPVPLLAMKQANEAYYREFLRPDMLVKNTLAIADSC